MADANIERMGHNLGYATDGRAGNPGLVVRDLDGTSQDGTWKLVAEPVIISVALSLENLATTGTCIFIADKAYEVLSIEEVHTVAESTAATLYLKLERCQGTEAAAAGDDLLAKDDVNLKGTANTVQSGTLLTTNDIHKLADGDRLVLHAATSATPPVATEPTELDGVCVTVRLAPIALSSVSSS